MAKRVQKASVQPRFKQRRRIFLKEWREYRTLTQEQLADRVGWSVGNVSQLERGLQGYSDEGLALLADALRCTPGQILDVDPTKQDAIWSLWETAQPGQRQEIERYAEFIGTGLFRPLVAYFDFGSGLFWFEALDHRGPTERDLEWMSAKCFKDTSL